MKKRELIYKDDARRAVLNANPSIAYCIDNVKPVLTDLYTLEEIAKKICASYDECSEECPGFYHCSKGKNGIVAWIESKMSGEKDV